MLGTSKNLKIVLVQEKVQIHRKIMGCIQLMSSLSSLQLIPFAYIVAVLFCNSVCFQFSIILGITRSKFCSVKYSVIYNIIPGFRVRYFFEVRVLVVLGRDVSHVVCCCPE